MSLRSRRRFRSGWRRMPTAISRGIYYVDDNGRMEYVRSARSDDGVLTVSVAHFSKYAALQVDAAFTDVPSAHWAWKAVRSLAAKQVVNGTAPARFDPSRQVTRAEFAAMLSRSLGLAAPQKEASPFGDVAPGVWYGDAVAAAAEAGIVNGRSASAFAPNEGITREEMAVMLMRAYDYANADAASAAGDAETGAAAPFADAAAFSGWAAGAIDRAAGLGLLSGRDGRVFDAKSGLTRAESAQALYKLLDL
ncbi:S-layer homology domain-containing protein [Cohnella rhizosphaerae]|uniref:S-layer homology domain-containing protein n=1 Tax=Cohnella rhizosphaerae TaxID=1457232 RepID=A0A9X4QSU3_9BACL|nr:S-layer homology domain-containing protein [Cohnella rhizosphaerae]MDG0809669.1 S-layer homology domain-containing protein [Cohnella rhizosphaerae]